MSGPYSGGPDTLVSVADTILNSSGAGIYSANGVYTLVDSAVVDTSGNEGIDLESLGRLLGRLSEVRTHLPLGSVPHSVVPFAFAVDGDPLADIEVLLQVRFVMKEGRVVKNALAR